MYKYCSTGLFGTYVKTNLKKWIFDYSRGVILLRTIFRQAVASRFSSSRLNNLSVPRHSF